MGNQREADRPKIAYLRAQRNDLFVGTIRRLSRLFLEYTRPLRDKSTSYLVLPTHIERIRFLIPLPVTRSAVTRNRIQLRVTALQITSNSFTAAF